MLRKLQYKIMSIPFSAKMVFFYMACAFSLFLVLTLVLIMLAEDYSRAQMYDSDINKIRYGNLMIEKEQRYMYGLADYYATAADVQRMLSDSNRGNISPMTSDLIKIAHARMYAVSLTFYNLMGDPVDYMSIDASSEPVPQSGSTEERPFQRLMRDNITYEWEFIDEKDTIYMLRDNSPKLALWRIVQDTNSFKPIGALCIALDTRKLLSTENNFDGLYHQLIVLDGAGQQVFNRSNITLTDEDLSLLLRYSNKSEGAFPLQLHGRDYQVVYGQIRDTDMKTFLIRDDVGLVAFRQSFLLVSLFVFLLSIVLLFPLAIWFSRSLTRPLLRLSRSMQAYAAGKEEVRIDFRYDDEIGRLGVVFNHMVVERKSLIEQAYLLRLREKEAELQALQAQIHPHFFYNIINLIYWKALRKGDEEIADIIYTIGQVFRMSLSATTRTTSLRQERDLIIQCLKLEKLRYGDRLEYQLVFPDRLLDIEIPKLIIQPLIENAICHGLGNRTATVHVQAKARLAQDGSMLIIEVCDDGNGIAPDILALLPDKLPSKNHGSGNHCALHNISDRLKLLYAGRANFLIESALGKGTRIVLSLPMDMDFKHKEVSHDSPANR